MAQAPDGMASMAQERKHMREMRQLEQQSPFTHDVVAIGPDGDEVDDALDDYPEGDDAPDGVDHYEIRER